MAKASRAPSRRDEAEEALLADLRAIITAGRGRAAAAVNAELVLTYWQIGERIVREEQQGQHRAAYGTQLLSRIGQRLQQEFGRAWGERNLQQMRQFSLAYPNANALRSELRRGAHLHRNAHRGLGRPPRGAPRSHPLAPSCPRSSLGRYPMS
jgi:DUF1016 N-terminal domain